MPEIIDLLSSPEPLPARVLPKSKTAPHPNYDAVLAPKPNPPLKAHDYERVRANADKGVKADKGEKRQTAKNAVKTVKKNARKPDPDSESDGFDFNVHVYTGPCLPKVAPVVASNVGVQKSGSNASLQHWPESNTPRPPTQQKPSSTASKPTQEPNQFTSNNVFLGRDSAHGKNQKALEDRIRKQEDEKLARSLQYGDIDDINLPPLNAIDKEPPKPYSILKSSAMAPKPTQSTNTSKGDADFAYLSDDSDTTVELDNSSHELPAHCFGLLGFTRKRMEEERLARVNRAKLAAGAPAKQTSETRKRKSPSPSLPSDDPFASDPPSKKRQISPPKAAVAPKPSIYKRPISHIETSSKPGTMKPRSTGLARSKSALESDPIVFTSSPDPHAEAATRRKANRMETLDEDEDFLQSAKEKPWKKLLKDYSFDTSDDDDEDNDFPKIDDIVLKPSTKVATKTAPKSKKSNNSLTALEQYTLEKKKYEEKDKKSQEKKQKALDKEAEKETKRLAKEEKAYEKGRAAELAKVNTLRTDKKVSTPEMLVDLPVSNGKSLLEQMGKAQGETLAAKARTFLDTLGVKVSDYESSAPIIKWRRKAEAEFNEDTERWEPVPLKIKPEKHIMYVLTAREFADLANGEEGHNLDCHTIRLRSRYDTNEIIYLIQGLTTWMRTNKNVKNRNFTTAMRSYEPEELTANGRPKKKKAEPEYIDENVVEEALLKLQVMHGMLIHHTNSLHETAEAIRAFTQHISTIPYKLQQQSLATTFCMESGQVKTGTSPADTYIKMLQEMVRITPAVAHGIAAEYPSVQALVQGFREYGEGAVADCRKLANRDGAFHDGAVGPAISRRLYAVFTGRDEWSCNV